LEPALKTIFLGLFNEINDSTHSEWIELFINLELQVTNVSGFDFLKSGYTFLESTVHAREVG